MSDSEREPSGDSAEHEAIDPPEHSAPDHSDAAEPGVQDRRAPAAAESTADPEPQADLPLPGFLGSLQTTLAAIPREQLALGFVISLAAAVLLPNLGRMGLFDCWETHYGEVAREMVVRNDYLYPYWKNAYFFSKPVLLLWMMAAGFNLAGANHRLGPLPEYTELGARFGVSLIALFCVVAVYLAMRHVFNRRAGIFSALVLVTSPMFLMIGRQAITDMPFVGLMTAGLSFFMISQFSESYQRSKWKQRVSPWVLGFFLSVTLPQYWLIIRSLKWLNGNPLGVRIAVFAACALLVIGVAFWLYKRGRDSALLLFYVLVALATLGKGLGGFALPGLVIFVYLLVTWDWGMLRRVQLLTGGLLFILVAFPWYVVLSLFTGQDDEHKTFAQRFWVHDHLNRLAAGVHGDKEQGSFDYFMRQLGFGTLSWAAIIPVALFDSLRRPVRSAQSREEKGRVFVTLWAVVLFVFFTAMQTKFHHYILPAVPPLAMVAGLWLSRLWDSKKVPSGLLLTALFIMTLLVALDGVRYPWSFIDMFTYHYISYKPEYYFPSKKFAYHFWIGSLTLLGVFTSVSVALYAHWDTLHKRFASREGAFVLWRGMAGGVHFVLGLMRDLGQGVSRLVGGSAARGLVLSFSATGIVMGIFMAQVYLMQLAPHWSQRYLFDTYWTSRQGDEPIIAYLMNWRGETFYALNNDIQIKNAGELKTRIKEPGTKYIVVESKRYGGLQSTLKGQAKKVEIVDRSNSKWYLVRVDP